MQNLVKKYLKSVYPLPTVSVHLFETPQFFGVDVEYSVDKHLNKRNQYKKEKYPTLEDCRSKAEHRFRKHISTIQRISDDAKFYKSK